MKGRKNLHRLTNCCSGVYEALSKFGKVIGTATDREDICMAETARQFRLLRFGDFEVDLRSGELRKAGVKLKFGGQPFQVLSILLEQPGDVVTREELQKRLWPDTFVDVDHNLNTAINKIREVLGDSAESPRFVETLPRRGYRFIGELERPNQAV